MHSTDQQRTSKTNSKHDVTLTLINNDKVAAEVVGGCGHNYGWVWAYVWEREGGGGWGSTSDLSGVANICYTLVPLWSGLFNQLRIDIYYIGT